jgi:hypothetical protein
LFKKKKRTGDVQAQSPEFKPQSYQKEKKIDTQKNPFS